MTVITGWRNRPKPAPSKTDWASDPDLNGRHLKNGAAITAKNSSKPNLGRESINTESLDSRSKRQKLVRASI